MLLAMARWRSARPSSALLRAAELTDSSTITCFVVKYFDGRSVALSVSYPCSSLLAIGYHSGGVRRGPTPQTGRLSGSPATQAGRAPKWVERLSGSGSSRPSELVEPRCHASASSAGHFDRLSTALDELDPPG